MSDTAEMQLPVLQNIERPMQPKEVLDQALVVHNILREVMVEGIHFGTVPGTDKPTLLQPGAEKINMTFRLAPKYNVEDLSEPHENFFRYRVTCSLYAMSSGMFVGSAVGEASSNEEKYQWQAAVCHEHWEATAPSDRRVKYFKTDKNEAGFGTVEQVRRNAADLANTVLKIAVKRASISATRGATAASDILDVDLDEEAVADVVRSEKAAPETKMKAKPKPAPKLNFGQSKGKHIDDPTVPVQDLQWMQQFIERNLGNPDRKQWAKGDQAMLKALADEIAKRQAEPKKEEPKKDEPKTDKRTPVTDEEWMKVLDSFQSDYLAEYEKACKELKVEGQDVPVAERWAFYDLMQKLIPESSK